MNFRKKRGSRHCGYRSHKLTSVGRFVGLFMTAGLLVSAHRAQGQHPWQGWVPTHQQGTGSLLAGGFTVGSAIARLPTPPTHQQGTHPCQGCCPCAQWAETNNPAITPS